MRYQRKKVHFSFELAVIGFNILSSFCGRMLFQFIHCCFLQHTSHLPVEIILSDLQINIFPHHVPCAHINIYCYAM